MHGKAMALPDRPRYYRVPVASRILSDWPGPASYDVSLGPPPIAIEEVVYERSRAECLGQQAEVYVIAGGRINELLERAIAQWLEHAGIPIFPR